ncbi:MAG: glycosyltransferase family 2 protein [Planctomycetota bacterium]|jgi:glycosyltransferase involved in cell wall biosynthesis
MAKVSICIPTYNRKNYLKETLESVFAQTYKDYEVVIVDDGSTDGTEQMIKQSNYPIRYFWQNNLGVSKARNKLIELAEGEYITFIDSDDLLFRYAVEDLMNLVECNGSDIVAYSSYVGIDERGNRVKRKPRKLPSGCIAADLFEYIYVHSCGTVCRKELFEEAGGFDILLPVCSEYALWLKLSLKYDFVPTARPAFKRRRHSGNLSAYSFANRKIELNMLEHAYQNGFGGKNIKEVITPARAMKRLAQEGYRAARCAIREGQQETACQLLKQSYQRHLNFKTLLWWLIAISNHNVKKLQEKLHVF